MLNLIDESSVVNLALLEEEEEVAEDEEEAAEDEEVESD